MPMVYERVGISVVEVYERVEKSVLSVCKKARKGKQMHFTAVKKSRKRSGFVIFTFTVVKRDARF